MFYAAFVSWRSNKLIEDDWRRIKNFLSKILITIKLPPIDQNLFREIILHDKKSEKQSVNFIMLSKLGESFIRKETPVEMLWKEFKEFTKKFTNFLEIEGR